MIRATWDRFLPCHTAESERARFDEAVKNSAKSVTVTVCKDLVKRGTSAFEYDWNSEEDEILTHALNVAGSLEVDLWLGAEESNSSIVAA